MTFNLAFNPKEKLDQFLVRLRAQAAVCSFGDQSEDMIMDKIVSATQTHGLATATFTHALPEVQSIFIIISQFQVRAKFSSCHDQSIYPFNKTIS